MNLHPLHSPLHMDMHIHNCFQLPHQTFCKCQAPTVCWALCKFQGTRHKSWPRPLGTPRLLVKTTLSPGE